MLVIVIANNNQQNMFNSCRCELLNGELLHENWPNGEKYQLENGNNQCKNVFFPFYLCWFLAIRVFLCHVWKIVFNSKQCHLDDDLVIPVLFFEPFLVFLRSARGRCHCCFCHYTFFFCSPLWLLYFYLIIAIAYRCFQSSWFNENVAFLYVAVYRL